ncbi:protein phosphatase 2C domain-containing protein [Dactylosporangium roseum]|uniref:Protein phosphatase 2C domain-containing protein n=1 Tax=Dactylosporangium roseum TaxID=47989 RepID=A0ABY5YV83_9ACTN|nr:protein phosphatase 2C domain-containing protein [Dactylosporangium roseum]UWZ33655.1 protein phosphatase 2C domain-containing protein [Dactylosporangium roseum]
MNIDVQAAGRRLRVGSATDAGRRYPANFDVLHAAALRQRPGLCAVVADGMGAGEGSRTAGRTAVDVFTTAVQDHRGPFGPSPLFAAVAAAQRRVRAAGRELRELTGCTLTALVADATGAWVTQIGDSRVYRLRGGLLELLTIDHTEAWLGAVHGWFPADSPQAAAARYQLHRFIGHPGLPEPDVLSVTMFPGDVYCLCTDGVAEQVPYRRVEETLGGGAPPDAVAAALVAAALEAGGRDNATAVVVAVR